MAHISGAATRRNNQPARWRFAQLIDQDLILIAWTVNDLRQVNELVPLGVSGFTTENLAIIEIVSHIPSLYWQLVQTKDADPP